MSPLPEPYWCDGDQLTLYHGDFRELLPLVVPDPTVIDLVVTDPPYGETSLGWDTWPSGWPGLVPARSMWCFGSMRMFLDRRDEFTDAGWRMSQDVVWEKQEGSGFATDRFRRVHEHVTHWYRGPWGSVHHVTPRPYAVAPRRMPPSGARQTKHGADQAPHTGAIGPGTWTDDGRRLIRSVIKAPNMHGRAINPTEKPAGLVEHLITYGAPPGGLVVDVFAGGGSTLVAARASGRRAIGFELREEQCASAVEHRLSQQVLPFDLSPQVLPFDLSPQEVLPIEDGIA